MQQCVCGLIRTHEHRRRFCHARETFGVLDERLSLLCLEIGEPSDPSDLVIVFVCLCAPCLWTPVII